VSSRIKIGGILKNPNLAALSVLGIADRPGIAATLLSALGRERVNVQFIVQCMDMRRQTHIVLCVDRSDLKQARALADAAAVAMGAETVDQIEEVGLVSIFGPDFRERPGIAGTMFGALADKGINILAISTSISTVACIIEGRNMNLALEALRETFELP
jgi:aspartate kinase